MERTHYNITVTGHVQGVFYRRSTLQKAQELDLTGYVQNQSDGSVYIEVEGPVSTLDTFTDWCKEGPERASVMSVEVDEDSLKNFRRFEIR